MVWKFFLSISRKKLQMTFKNLITLIRSRSRIRSTCVRFISCYAVVRYKQLLYQMLIAELIIMPQLIACWEEYSKLQLICIIALHCIAQKILISESNDAYDPEITRENMRLRYDRFH